MDTYGPARITNCTTGEVAEMPLTAEVVKLRDTERAAGAAETVLQVERSALIQAVKSAGKATLKAKNNTLMDNIPMPVLSSIVRAIIQELLPEWIDAAGVINVPD